MSDYQITSNKKPSNDILYKYYIIEKKSSIQIAKIIGVSFPTILKWLREANIKIRSKSENNLNNMNPNWDGGYNKIVLCNYCGNEIKKIKSQINNHNFCNKICEGKYQSINNCCKNNPSFHREKTKQEIKKQSESLRKTNENKRWNNQIINFIDGNPICDFIFAMINDIKLEDYNNWRKEIYKRDNYTCQMCNKNKCLIHAHHIIPKRLNKNLILNINNGITLCKDCHEKTFGKEESFINELQIIINNKENK